MEYTLTIVSETTPDWKFQITGPTGATAQIFYTSIRDGNNQSLPDSSPTAIVIATPTTLVFASTTEIVKLFVAVTNSTTPGTSPCNGQGTSNPTSTVVKAGSYAIANRV